MRKLSLFLTTFIAISSLSAQISDGSFEKWDTAFYCTTPAFSQYELVPQVWESNNAIHPDWHPFLVSTPASQSLESPFYDFSMQLESSATLGIDDGGPGILYQDISNESLTGISYWLKCDSLSGASGCIVEIFGIDQGLELLFQDSINEQQSTFQKYDVTASEFNAANYDSLRLQFRAVGYFGLTDNPIGFTRMLIDEVEASFLSNTSDLNPTEAIIFPNPSSGLLILESSKPISKIRLIDTQGREVISETCQKQNCELDISNQPNGLYTIHILFANGTEGINRVIKR